jgi:DNA-binding response OmpR family regulator
MRVLIAEDHKPLARSLRQGLGEQGFAVDLAHDGDEADFKARAGGHDVIVLEAQLPKRDGLALLQDWRHKGLDTHILLLTARPTTDERVRGLDLGADDCLTKPFQLNELVARLRALVRRAYRVKSPVLRVHDLEINTVARTVSRGGKDIRLTRQEYGLLHFLALHQGKLVTRTMIWEHLYDEIDENTSNVVDVYIHYLRTKVDKGFDPQLIQTRWGEGYVLRVEEERPARKAAAYARN